VTEPAYGEYVERIAAELAEAGELFSGEPPSGSAWQRLFGPDDRRTAAAAVADLLRRGIIAPGPSVRS
jgi:hypothetical protein